MMTRRPKANTTIKCRLPFAGRVMNGGSKLWSRAGPSSDFQRMLRNSMNLSYPTKRFNEKVKKEASIIRVPPGRFVE